MAREMAATTSAVDLGLVLKGNGVGVGEWRGYGGGPRVHRNIQSGTALGDSDNGRSRLLDFAKQAPKKCGKGIRHTTYMSL